MKKIMTLLIAMVAMFGLNSCDVFNEEKGSPTIEFGWEDSNGVLDFGVNGYFAGQTMGGPLCDALIDAIKSEGFTTVLAINKYITYDTYTNSEAKSVVKRIIKKVNVDQYKVAVDQDFVIRYKIDADNYTEVYRRNLSK